MLTKINVIHPAKLASIARKKLTRLVSIPELVLEECVELLRPRDKLYLLIYPLIHPRTCRCSWKRIGRIWAMAVPLSHSPPGSSNANKLRLLLSDPSRTAKGGGLLVSSPNEWLVSRVCWNALSVFWYFFFFYSSLNCLLAGCPWLTTDCHYTDSLDLQWRGRLVCGENIPEMEVRSLRRRDTEF